MLIDDILKNWEIDCVIDNDNLGNASSITPNLHAKYLRLLIDYKLKKVKFTNELSDLKLLKSKYFKGHLSTDELKDLGWEPYHLRVLKTEIDEHINADQDIQKIQTRLDYCNTAIYTLEQILQELKSRSFHTRVAMDWIKFRAGD